MKCAVLFDNFGPYHLARLNAAASVIEIIGIETSAKSQEYPWEGGAEPRFQRLTLYREANEPRRDCIERVSDSLCASHADVVAIPGWCDPTALAALSYCSDSAIPAILMSESTAEDEPRVAWREQIKRRIVALYSTALVGGQQHTEYLVQLGMPRERIFTGYDAVDNDHFARSAKKVESKREKVEGEYQLPENYFLASARFIEKKNLHGLIRAYARYTQNLKSQLSAVSGQLSKTWSLVILGDGPLKSDLCSLISDLRLQDHILLPGFKQYNELPVYYGLAKAFVHASTTEQWGLVVNEAMASGLPVIVSNRCGCVPELIQDGVNGFTFDPSDEQELTSHLVALSAMPEEERVKLGKASQRIVAGYGVERFASGLKEAAEMANTLPSKRAGFLDCALLAGLIKYPR